MGGILEVAGIPYFLADVTKDAADADPETERWRALVEKWLLRYPAGQEVRAANLLPLAEEIDGFYFGHRPEEKARQTTFGIHLHKRRNQVFTFVATDADTIASGTYRIVKARTWQGLAYYCLDEVKPDGEPEPSA